MSSSKAEVTKNFVKEYPADEIQQIVVDEHLTTKQMHNLENLAELPVIDRERLILECAWHPGGVHCILEEFSIMDGFSTVRFLAL
jgi:hypothetical protein